VSILLKYPILQRRWKTKSLKTENLHWKTVSEIKKKFEDTKRGKEKSYIEESAKRTKKKQKGKQ